MLNKLIQDYSDNSSELITSSEPIVPGEFTSSKTFTVTNNGNATTDYVVVIEEANGNFLLDTNFLKDC